MHTAALRKFIRHQQPRRAGLIYAELLRRRRGGHKAYRVSSWVVREKGLTVGLFETFNPKLVAALNTVKYEAVPIGDYLAEVNRKIKAGEPLEGPYAKPT